MDRVLRARVLVAEAQALGLSPADLVAASAGVPANRRVPTVREYRTQIERTFSPGTRRTYRSYWLLAERIFDDWVTEPWPGQLPLPAPALVHDPLLPVDVLDATGRLVGVDGRGQISAAPATLAHGPEPRRAVRDWAGPWPCDERWWDPETHRRRARLQVVDDTASAYLLVLEQGCWGIEATCDWVPSLGSRPCLR